MIRWLQGLLGWHESQVRRVVPIASPPFLISSVPKCGLSWISAMLGEYGFRRFSEPKDLGADAIRCAGGAIKRMRSSDFYAHHINYELVRHVVQQSGLPCFVLHRDPRDAIVSLYHHVRKKGYWQDRSFNDVFASELLWMSFRDFTFFGLRWLESYPRAAAIRYEDLVADPVEALHGLLTCAGCEVDRERLISVTAQFSREQVAKSEKLHFRRGEVGEHRAVFTAEQVQQYSLVMGHIHRRLGYSL